jgi:elongation factor Ts
MEITAALVKKLRDETDAPMMECKRALSQAAEEGATDEAAALTRAKEILREGGKLQAGKRADRAVSQGVVAVARHGNAAAAVALLCETDFVARNEDFRALAQKLAAAFAKDDPGQHPELANVDGRPVKDLLEEAVAKIRENIQLGAIRRVEGDGVGVYLHHDNMKAALIVVSGGNGTAGEIANKIGTQVVALSPEYISKEQVDNERLSKEIELEKQRAIDAGKPAEIAEKIAQGKVQKEFLSQVVLLEQPWYADLGKRVSEVIGPIKVRRIVRLEAGKNPVDSSLG